MNIKTAGYLISLGMFGTGVGYLSIAAATKLTNTIRTKRTIKHANLVIKNAEKLLTTIEDEMKKQAVAQAEDIIRGV